MRWVWTRMAYRCPSLLCRWRNLPGQLCAAKRDYIGREALERQYGAFRRIMNREFQDMADLPRRIQPITLLDRGVMRSGMPVYRNGRQIGWVTSGTMVPYYRAEGEGLETVILDETAKRAIGLCYIDSDVLEDDRVEVDVRGKRLQAVIPPYHMRVDAPPFARPILYGLEETESVTGSGNRTADAVDLLRRAGENHLWRQKQCINLIPSENTPSRAVQLLCASDPAFRYAEHKKVKSFYDKDIFYYQGTEFIDRVEQLLVEQMRQYLGCAEVETRTISGQMSNMATFSALMDWKNRLDRKHDPRRLGVYPQQPYHQRRASVGAAHGSAARLRGDRSGYRTPCHRKLPGVQRQYLQN